MILNQFSKFVLSGLRPFKGRQFRMKMHLLVLSLALSFGGLIQPSNSAWAEDLEIGELAPTFILKNQDGQEFNLESRKNQGWTVLYFYPKSGTQGCTEQAATYEKTITKIRGEKAEVYGISADSVEQQQIFHQAMNLTFDLLADPTGDVISQYGVKWLGLNIARRWTFLIDPQLRIQAIEKDVEPSTDPERILDGLKEFNKRKQS